MSDNPLSGLSIPSLEDISSQVVDHMGAGIIDLANPLQRKRLKEYIESAIGMAINFELERALHAASSRAITHVFKIMRDAEYQENKRRRREGAAKRRLEKRAKREEAEREARMDYSRRNMKVNKSTIQ